jgi:hypothetical protein
MLASAFIVGPPDGPGAALRQLANTIGFTAVLPFGGVTLAEQQAARTPLCFFLFAAVDDVSAMATSAGAIRFSPSRRIRFSPLVYFSESPSVQTIRSCIEMGFDDIITMPFTTARVGERLRAQIERRISFFETSGYFGPDRRDRLPPAHEAHPMRGSGGQHRKIEIIRSYEAGVRVIRDDMHMAA